MKITRFDQAPRYDAPGHFDMRGLRLQGFEVSSVEFAWTGLSQFLPGGGAEMDSSPLEKIYVVLEGEVSIILGSGEKHRLSKLDSCYISGDESRAIVNESNHMATMLVIMPYQEQS